MASKGDEDARSAPQPPPKAEECECEEGAPAWVVTFGDLMSLLLTFFVLLLSFSNMDDQKFKELAGSLSEAFGVQRAVPVFDLPRGMDMIARDFNQEFSDVIVRELKETVKQFESEEAERGEGEEGKGAAPAVEIDRDARGLVIRMSDAVLFESGADRLLPKGRRLLARLAPTLRRLGGEILVEGHTDDRPFRRGGEGFGDGNWELSYRRGLAVAAFLRKPGGIPIDHLAITARGPTRPLAPNDTEEGRARNRRVEIVLLKPIRPARTSKEILAGARPGPATRPSAAAPERSARSDAAASDASDARVGPPAEASAPPPSADPPPPVNRSEIDPPIPEAFFSPTEGVPTQPFPGLFPQ